MTDSESVHGGVKRVTVDHHVGAANVFAFDSIHVTGKDLVDDSSEHVCRFKLQLTRTSRRTEASPEDVRVAILLQQRPIVVRIRRDQHARPVAFQFEEERIREGFAVEGAALDEEPVSSSLQPLVDPLRLADLGKVLPPGVGRIQPSRSRRRRARQPTADVHQ